FGGTSHMFTNSAHITRVDGDEPRPLFHFQPHPGLENEPDPGRLREILGRHADAVFDLSSTFDATDPTEFEISTDDDHPNPAGHRRIFQGLSTSLVQNELRDALVPTSMSVTPPAATVAAE
ncbi:SGNH/GDSL hydrolase family protein, partial [Singulisphaera rosea]